MVSEITKKRKLNRIQETVPAIVLIFLVGLTCCSKRDRSGEALEGYSAMSDKVIKTEGEWKEILTPEQFDVLRKKGTERAYSGEYWDTKTPGIYVCVACSNELFSSEDKYDSGTGWPSFTSPIREDVVYYEEDRSFFMARTEVRCSRCDSHLGHVFDDGPEPTGKRFCMNSICLKLIPSDNQK